MANGLMRLLDAGFGHPRGRLGHLGGRLMARGNVEQERWAVTQADLQTRNRVLVLGPGPGVGLALAAATVGPTGRVVGVDPSETMRDMAAARCARDLARSVVELHAGTAERTGCESGAFDAAISVNNVMMWDLPAGFAELTRVLRPDGLLVVTVHRHVLGVAPALLREQAEHAGLRQVSLHVRERRLNSPAVELLARHR